MTAPRDGWRRTGYALLGAGLTALAWLPVLAAQGIAAAARACDEAARPRRPDEPGRDRR